MGALVTILIVLAAIALVLVVLVQKSKGSGLASGFSSSNQIMGVRKTTDFIEKATWGLMGVIIVLSLASAAFIKDAKPNTPQSVIEAPTFPTTNMPADVSTTIPSTVPAPTTEQE